MSVENMNSQVEQNSEVNEQLDSDFDETNFDSRVEPSNELPSRNNENLSSSSPRQSVDFDERVNPSEVQPDHTDDNSVLDFDDRVPLQDEVYDRHSLMIGDDISNGQAETIDGQKQYFDDNGDLYRIDDDFLPNTTYEINGYKYSTDDQGRIVSAEGIVHLKSHEGKKPIKDSMDSIGKGDQKEGDDRGHLIGDQLDGGNGLENMVPQEGSINKGEYNRIENEVAKAVKEGKEVSVKVEPIYQGDSHRPVAISYTRTINGETTRTIVPNRRDT